MNPRRRHAAALRVLALVAVAAGGLAACEAPEAERRTEADDPSNVRLDVRAASTPDSLGGADPVVALSVWLRSDEPPQEARADLAYSETTGVETAPPFRPFLPTRAARLTVHGMGFSGAVRSVGRSAPFVLPAQGAVDVPVFLGIAGGFSEVAAPSLARAGAATVPLGDGRVLVVGGRSGTELLAPALYDHRTGEVTQVGGEAPRVLFPAAGALAEGRAFVAGGVDETGQPVGDAWLFTGQSFTALPFQLPRQYGGAAAFFPEENRVVVVGGFGPGPAPRQAIREAALVDLGATVELVEITTSLSEARGFASATALDGITPTAVLLAGGLAAEDGPALASAEVLSLDATGPVQVAGTAAGGTNPQARDDLGVARAHHTAVALPGGEVLVFGGGDGTVALPDLAPVLFSPLLSNPGGFIPVQAPNDPGLNGPRAGAAGALLPDGSVLVAGGLGLRPGDAGAFRFEPSAGQDPTIAALYQGFYEALPDASPPAASASRAGGVIAPLLDGAVLVLGGAADHLPGPEADDASPPAAEIFVARCDRDDPCLP